MKENYVTKQNSDSVLETADLQKDSSRSSAAPIIGAALGLMLLLLISRKGSKPETQDPGSNDDPDLKNFIQSVSNVKAQTSSTFFYSVRSSLNSTAIHDLDLLLSISVYPLMTSTITKAINALKNGDLVSYEDVRLFVFMNLFMKIRKDRSGVPFTSQALIGHRASFLISSNAGFNASETMFWKEDIMRFTPGFVYNGINYMVRSNVPFPLTDENPLYGVNPPQGFRLVQFPLGAQPSDKWNQLVQTSTQDHLIPNLRREDGSLLSSSHKVEEFILSNIRSNPSEYSEGYFMNIAKESGWLEKPDFYLNLDTSTLSIDNNSNAYFVLSSGLKVKTESEFINALVNSNTLLPLAHESFYDISRRFADFEGAYGAVVTFFGTSETVFGHHLDIGSSTDHWAADRTSTTRTNTNFAQLGLEIIDPILRAVVRHSRQTANQFFPSSSLQDFQDDDLSTTEWKDPLFVVEIRKHVYFKLLPDPGPWS